MADTVTYRQAVTTMITYIGMDPAIYWRAREGTLGERIGLGPRLRVDRRQAARLVEVLRQYVSDVESGRLAVAGGAHLLEKYVFLGEYEKALGLARDDRVFDIRMAMKRPLGLDIEGHECATMFRAHSGAWQVDLNDDDFQAFIDIQVASWRELAGGNFIAFEEKWLYRTIDSRPKQVAEYVTLVPPIEGLVGRRGNTMVLRYYDHMEQCLSELGVSRLAETVRQFANAQRTRKGLPRIGEGWVSETALYQSIKARFPALKIVQHARPMWLEPQHIDVFLPEIELAVEYQGKQQHDQPLKYFGGKKAHAAQRKRDARKKSLCQEHGVLLLEVVPYYDFEQVAAQIADRIRTHGIVK